MNCFSLLLMVLILTACENSQNRQSRIESSVVRRALQQEPEPIVKMDSASQQGVFEKLCRRLPRVSIPFEIYCEDCCAHPDLNDSLQGAIRSYLPEGASFVGVIAIREHYISLLITFPADWIVPAVATFRKDGMFIDQQFFMGGYCGSDYGYFGKQFLQIPVQDVFIEADTAYYLAYDEADEIVDTTRMEVTIDRFRVDERGKIVKTNHEN